jgi:light-regulated signal transduction histidine kinase (bacteriophytochrome)
MIHPEDAAKTTAIVHGAFRTGNRFQMELRIKERGDGYRWHLARALPLRDGSGRIFRWFGTCTDIEDQKRTEQALEAARAQLDQHAQTLERRVAERTTKLEETIKSLEGVLYHIAHDLRAPLRAMAGFAQMLEESQLCRLDEEGKDFAQRIVAGAKRMDWLIHDLLAYGRLGHSRMRFTRVPLERACERVMCGLAADIKRRNAEVEVSKPLPAVRADCVVLEDVLAHILKNALTFVATGVMPRVHIWAERRGSADRLWIQDNGIGIDMEHWARIFHVFERLHRVDEYTGTGIGLAIVWKGMERMGGAVGVESRWELKSQPVQDVVSCCWLKPTVCAGNCGSDCIPIGS